MLRALLAWFKPTPEPQVYVCPHCGWIGTGTSHECPGHMPLSQAHHLMIMRACQRGAIPLPVDQRESLRAMWRNLDRIAAQNEAFYKAYEASLTGPGDPNE